jgi:hypothetical protein
MRLLLKKSFLAMLNGSVGSSAYRHFYGKDGTDSTETDLLQDGRLSCAHFVSSLLLRFQLIATPHLTVSGTIRDLKTSGWKKTEQPRAGDVVVWAPIEEFGGMHEHIGFWINETRAISNSSSQGTPVEHHLTFGVDPTGKPVRETVAFYTLDRFQAE